MSALGQKRTHALQQRMSALARVGCLRKRPLIGNNQKIYAVFRIPDGHDGFAGSSRIWSSASFSSARTASDRLRIRFSNRKSSIAAISLLVSSITRRLVDSCMQETVSPASEKVDAQMSGYAHYAPFTQRTWVAMGCSLRANSGHFD